MSIFFPDKEDFGNETGTFNQWLNFNTLPPKNDNIHKVLLLEL